MSTVPPTVRTPLELERLDFTGLFVSDGNRTPRPAAAPADPWALPASLFAPSVAALPLARLATQTSRTPTPPASEGPSPVRPPSLSGPRLPSSSRELKLRRTDPELPPIGTVIDKYRLEEVIGVGGFAVVYRARHLLLRVPVAMKLLKPRVLRQQPYLAPLLCEEAAFAAQINHPNVVRVYDVTHTEKITYIVMEYIEGPTLAEALENRRIIPYLEALDIARDVSAGLAAGLAQGLIHRDVKPANVLLAKDGRAKLVDLGLAQPNPDGIAPRGETNFTAGTPGYMSPEQASRPEVVDYRSDMYSLGVTLYQMTTGRPPFPVQDAMKSIEMHLSSPVPPPETLVPNYPPRLARLVLWLLEKNHESRPGSYEVLDDELVAVRRMLAAGGA